MSAKRSRMVRSSSTSRFNNYQRFYSIEPPRVASKPRVQKQTKTAVPLKAPGKVMGPRPSIFSIEPLKGCRERDDAVKTDFWTMCCDCKRDIREASAYMYGYFQAFCSPECRDKRIAVDEKTRKPSPVQLKRNIKLSKRFF